MLYQFSPHRNSRDIGTHRMQLSDILLKTLYEPMCAMIYVVNFYGKMSQKTLEEIDAGIPAKPPRDLVAEGNDIVSRWRNGETVIR